MAKYFNTALSSTMLPYGEFSMETINLNEAHDFLLQPDVENVANPQHTNTLQGLSQILTPVSVRNTKGGKIKLQGGDECLIAEIEGQLPRETREFTDQEIASVKFNFRLLKILAVLFAIMLGNIFSVETIHAQSNNRRYSVNVNRYNNLYRGYYGYSQDWLGAMGQGIASGLGDLVDYYITREITRSEVELEEIRQNRVSPRRWPEIERQHLNNDASRAYDYNFAPQHNQFLQYQITAQENSYDYSPIEGPSSSWKEYFVLNRSGQTARVFLDTPQGKKYYDVLLLPKMDLSDDNPPDDNPPIETIFVPIDSPATIGAQIDLGPKQITIKSCGMQYKNGVFVIPDPETVDYKCQEIK